MVNINLLPWRYHVKRRQKIQLVKILSIVILVIVLISSIQAILSYRLTSEQQDNLDLKKQFIFLTMQPHNHIENQDVTHVFKQFQHNQQQLLEFFTQVLQAAPESIVWQAMLSQGSQVILKGETSSLPILLEWVKQFDGVKTIFHAEIIKIKNVNQTDVFQFSMQFFQVLIPFKK